MKPLAAMIALSMAGCMAPSAPEGGNSGNTLPEKSGSTGGRPESQPPRRGQMLGEEECGLEAAQSLVGKTRSAELEAEAEKITGAKRVRWIAPGSAVTMDYNPTRLNIDLDDKGKIVRVHCG